MRSVCALRSALLSAFTLCALCLIGCREPDPKLPASPTPDMGTGDASADMLADAGADTGQDLDVDAGGDAISRPSSWRVLISPEAPEAARWAAEDVVTYLGQMGQQVELVESNDEAEVRCSQGEEPGVIAMRGEGLGELQGVGKSEQRWAYREQECEGGGALVELGGGGLLGRQYAVYEWLHALGVRYFHPEQEHIPEQPRWPKAERLERVHTPDFTWRSVSLHLTHPLELGDIFRLGKEEYALEGKRYIDWQVKNGASYGHVGFGDGEYKEYGVRRGLPRVVGFPLHSQQQGDGAIVDPDDPRPSTEQIAEAITLKMGSDPQSYPKFLHFTFNPSEFTELPIPSRWRR